MLHEAAGPMLGTFGLLAAPDGFYLRPEQQLFRRYNSYAFTAGKQLRSLSSAAPFVAGTAR
jgi:hypothetical protein